MFSNSSGLKGVFGKLSFRDRSPKPMATLVKTHIIFYFLHNHMRYTFLFPSLFYNTDVNHWLDGRPNSREIKLRFQNSLAYRGRDLGVTVLTQEWHHFRWNSSSPSHTHTETPRLPSDGALGAATNVGPPQRLWYPVPLDCVVAVLGMQLDFQIWNSI